MISDTIARQLTMILNATKQNRIEWKPIDIYLKCDRSNENLNEYLKSIIEFKTLNYDISFFCRKDEKYLILLDYMNSIHKAFGKDKQEHQIEILSIAYKGAIIQQIPDYFEMNFTIQDFQKSIQQYWNTKTEKYSLELSDMLDTLETFSNLAIGKELFGEIIEED